MEEIVQKFNRVCDFKKVDPGQRDKARTMWTSLRSVPDIGDALATLATFGSPRPL